MMSNRGDKFISTILVLAIIILILVIGIFSYTLYTQIMGEGSLQINFENEAGFPTIEYVPSNNNTINVAITENLFSGVESGNANNPETIVKSQYKPLYNQLSDEAKIIYAQLYQNKENLKTGIYRIEFGNTFSSLLSQENGSQKLQQEYQSAIEALIYENPDIFYIDATNMYINIEKITKITGVKYNVYINPGSNINYLSEGFYSKEDVERREQEIENIKNEIIAKVYNKSDYEKIRYVHDYLIDSIEYDTSVLQSNIYNIYGALVSKRCVCEGYAKAFQYLMTELGIDNTIVIGTATNSNSDTENHAWNYVKLNNNWYAVDTTWDDPILIGRGVLSQKSRYQYFLKGSQTMNQNHITSGKFTAGGQVFVYPTLSVTDYK